MVDGPDKRRDAKDAERAFRFPLIQIPIRVNPRNPCKILPLRSAGFRTCGFTELSSSVFRLAAGKSPGPARWKTCATHRWERCSRSNELDGFAARQMDEVGFACQPDDSPGTLFSASIIDFRDEAGKRLVLFLRIGFHGPT